MTSLMCGFGQSFPDEVADLLEREAYLSRAIREETITDLWLGAMLPWKRYGVEADYSNEPVTGGDLELWFLSRRLDRSLSFVIQAKRLHCHREAAFGSKRKRPPFPCLTKNLDRHGYWHLDHPGGMSKGQQAKDLINQRDADGEIIYPLYAFYNPRHACNAETGLKGVILADGFGVESEIRKGLAKGSSTARRYKQVRTLKKHFLDFESLFCTGETPSLLEFVARTGTLSEFVLLRFRTSGVDVLTIPDPEEIAAQFRELIQSARGDQRTDHPLPSVREGVPTEIRNRVLNEDRESISQERHARPQRKRIIFRASAETQHER